MLSLQRQVIDSKESIFNVLSILETLGSCSSSNKTTNIHPGEISALKNEAYQLLAEIDDPVMFSAENNPYHNEEFFSEKFFIKRFEEIRNRIAMLQNPSSHNG